MSSLFEEKKAKGSKGQGRSRRKISPKELREIEEAKEAETLRNYKRVNELWDIWHGDDERNVEKAKREWEVEAEKLLEMFRETRNLFSTNRVSQRRFFFGSKLL